MIYFSIFLYYTIISSSVLIYGLGLNNISEVGITKNKDIIFFIKNILTIVTTSIFSWLIANYILLPIKLIEFFPFVSLLVFIVISAFFESIVRIITGKNTVEYIMSYLIVLLSVWESSSLIYTIFISISCLISYLLLVPVCIVFKNKLSNNGNVIDENYYSLLFVVFAILLLILSVWDIVWLNPGVI